MNAPVLLGIAVLAFWCGSSQPSAAGQDTRADEQRAEREEKQKTTTPPTTNFLERTLKAVERSGVPLITRDGIYLKLGTLTTGSGFTFGGGYRTRRFLARDAGLDMWGGATRTGYWATQASLQVPLTPAGRIVGNVYGRHHDYPREDYFGLGPETERSSQTDFRLEQTTVGGRANARLAGPLAVGGGVEFVRPRASSGKDPKWPSTGDVHGPASAPGIDARLDYLRTLAFVDVDFRRPINARRGGWYRAEWSRYDDRSDDLFTFNRLDVDLRHYVSILSERRILTGRAFVSTSDTAAGQTMPFYLMPWLGGNDSLRGFRDYRFRGPHALLLQAEYRFEIWSGLDGALFYDAGKVALRRSDLDFKQLERDYGFGLRFNTDDGIIFRFDTALGSRDGARFWMVFGGTF
jgi:hypothetical protein